MVLPSERNKQTIVLCGAIKPLLSLAQSPDIRVRRNATGALLNLTHLRKYKSNRIQPNFRNQPNGDFTMPDTETNKSGLYRIMGRFSYCTQMPTQSRIVFCVNLSVSVSVSLLMSVSVWGRVNSNIIHELYLSVS